MDIGPGIFFLRGYFLSALYCFEVICCLAHSLFYATGSLQASSLWRQRVSYEAASYGERNERANSLLAGPLYSPPQRLAPVNTKKILGQIQDIHLHYFKYNQMMILIQQFLPIDFYNNSNNKNLT